MATAQAILVDINLRYRNSFTDSQKLIWLNEEQVELFDILELDSPPYTFQTIQGENFYPFPYQFDVTKIKVVTYQIDEGDNPNYVEAPFLRNDDNQRSSYVAPWYTIVSDAMYLYVPSEVPEGRNVYVYCDSDPTEVTLSNLSAAPDLPTRYQEILKLGILKRIAGARKDTQMYNNYDMEHEQKISDILLQKKLKEPEWTGPVDVMPRLVRGWRRGTVAVITQTTGSP